MYIRVLLPRLPPTPPQQAVARARGLQTQTLFLVGAPQLVFERGRGMRAGIMPPNGPTSTNFYATRRGGWWHRFGIAPSSDVDLPSCVAQSLGMQSAVLLVVDSHPVPLAPRWLYLRKMIRRPAGRNGRPTRSGDVRYRAEQAALPDVFLKVTPEED